MKIICEMKGHKNMFPQLTVQCSKPVFLPRWKMLYYRCGSFVTTSSAISMTGLQVYLKFPSCSEGWVLN